MRVIKHAGSLLPLAFVVLFALAVLSSLDGALTWERPLTYGAATTSLALGTYALIRMAQESFGSRPSLFLTTLIYHKGSLFLTYLGILLSALKNIYPGFAPWMPEWMVWALLVSTSGMLFISNLILFFGRHRHWLEATTNAVPFASLVESVKRRLPKGRRHRGPQEKD